MSSKARGKGAIQRLRRASSSSEGLQWGILLVLVVVAVALALVGTALSGQARNAALGNLATNLATEFAGAAATYWLLQRVLGRRATKEELIAQMGSDVRDVAVPGAEEMRRRGWLTDGSLEGANLYKANLEKADLRHAQLQRAELRHAKLQGADLRYALLDGADLEDTQLRLLPSSGPIVLQEVEGVFHPLPDPGVQWAKLTGVVLAGANLAEADVARQQLAEAKSLAATTLPDGTKLSEDNWEAEFEEWRQQQDRAESDAHENQ